MNPTTLDSDSTDICPGCGEAENCRTCDAGASTQDDCMSSWDDQCMACHTARITRDKAHAAAVVPMTAQWKPMGWLDDHTWNDEWDLDAATAWWLLDGRIEVPHFEVSPFALESRDLPRYSWTRVGSLNVPSGLLRIGPTAEAGSPRSSDTLLDRRATSDRPGEVLVRTNPNDNSIAEILIDFSDSETQQTDEVSLLAVHESEMQMPSNYKHRFKAFTIGDATDLAQRGRTGHILDAFAGGPAASLLDLRPRGAQALVAVLTGDVYWDVTVTRDEHTRNVATLRLNARPVRQQGVMP